MTRYGNVHGTLAIASRDLMKFVRDPMRLVGTFVSPFVMMTLMGGLASRDRSTAVYHSRRAST